jgi:hypothetical protein
MFGNALKKFTDISTILEAFLIVEKHPTMNMYLILSFSIWVVW